MIIAKENTNLDGAPTAYVEAHDALSRALFALRLEVDGGIVIDLTDRVHAAVEAARSWGMQIALGESPNTTVVTLQEHHIETITDALECLHLRAASQRGAIEAAGEALGLSRYRN